jgi:hypothetical protein
MEAKLQEKYYLAKAAYEEVCKRIADSSNDNIQLFSKQDREEIRASRQAMYDTKKNLDKYQNYFTPIERISNRELTRYLNSIQGL